MHKMKCNLIDVILDLHGFAVRALSNTARMPGGTQPSPPPESEPKELKDLDAVQVVQ
jgi:hypothetical protein